MIPIAWCDVEYGLHPAGPMWQWCCPCGAEGASSHRAAAEHEAEEHAQRCGGVG